jgi:hypothetical protein
VTTRQWIGVRLLTICAAFAVMTAGLVLAARPSPANRVGVPGLHTYQLIAIGVGIVVLAQFARIRVRAGKAVVQLAWGEAALVVLCYLLPAGWVPAVTMTGVVISQMLFQFIGDRRTGVMIAHNIAALGLASGSAAGVALAHGFLPDAPVTA